MVQIKIDYKEQGEYNATSQPRNLATSQPRNLATLASIVAAGFLLTACGGSSSSSDSGPQGFGSEYQGLTSEGKVTNLTDAEKQKIAKSLVRLSSIYEAPYYLNNIVDDFLYIEDDGCDNSTGTTGFKETNNSNSYDFKNCEYESGDYDLENTRYPVDILNGKLKGVYQEQGDDEIITVSFDGFSFTDKYMKDTVLLNGAHIEKESDTRRNESWNVSVSLSGGKDSLVFTAKGEGIYNYSKDRGEYNSSFTFDGETYQVKADIDGSYGFLLLDDAKFYLPELGYFYYDDDFEGDDCEDEGYTFDRHDGKISLRDADGNALITVNFKGCGKSYGIE